jgi:hypothetical protein
MGGDTIALGQGVLGGGITIGSVLLFIRWMCEFIAKRADVRAAALDLRQKAIEERYDDRLHHLEIELNRTRRAATMLLNWIGREHPSSPVLQQAADLLADLNVQGPITDMPSARDPEIDRLAAQVGRTLE